MLLHDPSNLMEKNYCAVFCYFQPDSIVILVSFLPLDISIFKTFYPLSILFLLQKISPPILFLPSLLLPSPRNNGYSVKKHSPFGVPPSENFIFSKIFQFIEVTPLFLNSSPLFTKESLTECPLLNYCLTSDSFIKTILPPSLNFLLQEYVYLQNILPF